MKLKKLFQPVRIAWLFILTLAVFYNINTTFDLIKSESDTAQTSLDSINGLDLQVKNLSQQFATLQSQSDPSLKLTQLAQVQQELTIGVQTLTEQSAHFVSQAQLTDLQNQLQKHGESLKRLNDNISNRQTAEKNTQPAQPGKNKKAAIPFNVLGVELRGGQYVLSVMPVNTKNQKNISSVIFLEVGNSMGNWQLKSLDGNTAIFKAGSKIRRLSIPNYRSNQ